MRTELFKPKSMNSNAGFTLAEVLITLGIIGIVAAMTLPTLLANSKKQETTVAIKKFLSTFQQAVMLSEVTNGPASSWKQSRCAIRDDCTEEEIAAAIQSSEDMWNTYLKDYMKYLKSGKDTEFNNLPSKDLGEYIVYLNDGTTFGLKQASCMDISFDANGDKLPNAYGRDRFVFLLCTDEAGEWTGDRNNVAMITYGGKSNARDRNRTNALNQCKSNVKYCSYLLQMDGWEFKDDYPYKL